MRLLTAGAACALALVLAGCSSTSQYPGAAATTNPALTKPCSLVQGTDLSALFPDTMPEPTEATEPISDKTGQFTAHTCRWADDATGTTVLVRVAQATDFAGKKFACPELPGSAEAVGDLGKKAWWSSGEADGAASGRLRACSDSARVDVLTNGAAGSDDTAKTASVALAKAVLDAA